MTPMASLKPSFYIANAFSNHESAIDAAIQAGQRQIDAVIGPIFL
jgi:hypothetical protein